MINDQVQGTIIRRTKGFYYIRTESGEEVECKIKRSLFRTSRFNNQAAVGDVITYKQNASGKIGLITAIEPRKSFLSRVRVGIEAEQVIAANVDCLIIVAAAMDPILKPNFIFRLITAASAGNITPYLIISKTDLTTPEKIEEIIRPFQNLDMDILFTSPKHCGDQEKIIQILKNNTSVITGQSGVGKSSLLNRLFPGLEIKVGEVSQKTGKGSHTTTYAIMHEVAPESFVIDTPGIREFSLWQVNRKNLNSHFPIIQDYVGCKHRDCVHITEPGCAVKNATQTGELDPEIYESYRSIYEALEEPQSKW